MVQPVSECPQGGARLRLVFPADVRPQDGAAEWRASGGHCRLWLRQFEPVWALYPLYRVVLNRGSRRAHGHMCHGRRAPSKAIARWGIGRVVVGGIPCVASNMARSVCVNAGVAQSVYMSKTTDIEIQRPPSTNRVAAVSTSNRVVILREDVVDHRPQPMIWWLGPPGPVAHRHELRGRRAEEDRRPRPPGVIAGEVETYSQRHGCQDEGAAMPPSRGES